MKRLMEQIGKAVKGRIREAELSHLENEIRKCILRGFASRGRAPTPEEIAAQLALPIDTVSKAIEKLGNADILRSRGGHIISAYPFSAVGTHHRVIFEDGHEVYALCATDALGVHFMLGEDITVLSTCPECKDEIRIAVREGRITSITPEDAVEFVAERERCGCTAETLCPFINFFCSREHLLAWRLKNPEYRDGEAYSPDEALEHGKAIFGDFLEL
ncbi:organomercurial lyase [Candidatus Pyrohabitans sp.]